MRARRRWVRSVCAAAVIGRWVAGWAASAAGAPEMAIVSPAGAAEDDLRLLTDGLHRHLGTAPRRWRPGGGPATGESGALGGAAAALFVGGPGARLGADEWREIKGFIEAGKGVVLVAAQPEHWPADFDLAALLGAAPAGSFLRGAALDVINLLPHAVLTGVPRLETRDGVRRYEKLADDAALFIEGTSGETTTPLAWLRGRDGRRLCHVALTGRALWQDPAYPRLLANALRWTARQAIPGAQAIVQRTVLPESYPGAFAITFPEGPGVCLDPVRGGVSYVWDGDFVDLRPRWLTKQGEPARVFGTVFYRETEWQPLRAGGPDAEPQFRFRGYRMTEGSPEFHYEIGGREVWETLAAGPEGALQRRFRVSAGDVPLWLRLEPQPGAEVTLHGIERDGALACFAAKGAGEFTVEIRRKAVRVP